MKSIIYTHYSPDFGTFEKSFSFDSDENPHDLFMKHIAKENPDYILQVEYITNEKTRITMIDNVVNMNPEHKIIYPHNISDEHIIVEQLQFK